MTSVRYATALAAVFGLLGSACERASDSVGPGADVGPPTFDVTVQSAPANNDFANATVVTPVDLPYSDALDITDATAEPGEPTSSCWIWAGFADRSAWYTFIPGETGAIAARLLNGIGVLAVYRGSSFADLVEVACDPFGGRVAFRAEAGTAYYFQVHDILDQGSSVLFTLATIPPPLNDAFADATGIPEPLPFDDVVDIAGATEETGEPLPQCAFGPVSRTVWYAFTPTTSGSVTASLINPQFSSVVAAYAGDGLTVLTQLACRAGFGGPASFHADAGTTYYIQVASQSNQSGPLTFRLEVAPPPFADFGANPGDPSVFDDVQFSAFAFDPADIGIQSLDWRFGDGAAGVDCCPTHRYAADGDYVVELTATTFDGRTTTVVKTLSIRTHDVAITRFAVPKAASAGQTRQIVVGINSRRAPETVEVQLFKSVPGSFQMIGVLRQSVPVRPSNRTTDFNFSYTFTADDARVGKVTFKAIATIVDGRDALPADNEAIAAPTTVSR